MLSACNLSPCSSTDYGLPTPSLLQLFHHLGERFRTRANALERGRHERLRRHVEKRKKVLLVGLHVDQSGQELLFLSRFPKEVERHCLVCRIIVLAQLL